MVTGLQEELKYLQFCHSSIIKGIGLVFANPDLCTAVLGALACQRTLHGDVKPRAVLCALRDVGLDQQGYVHVSGGGALLGRDRGVAGRGGSLDNWSIDVEITGKVQVRRAPSYTWRQ